MVEEQEDLPEEESLPMEGEDEEDLLPLDVEPEEESIGLVETSEETHTAVRAFGSASVKGSAQHYEFKRPMNVTGKGATRCRLFHSRIATGPLQHIEHHINEWIDTEGIEVKQVGHVVGIMEGKAPEPNLVIVIWY